MVMIPFQVLVALAFISALVAIWTFDMARQATAAAYRAEVAKREIDVTKAELLSRVEALENTERPVDTTY